MRLLIYFCSSDSGTPVFLVSIFCLRRYFSIGVGVIISESVVSSVVDFSLSNSGLTVLITLARNYFENSTSSGIYYQIFGINLTFLIISCFTIFVLLHMAKAWCCAPWPKNLNFIWNPLTNSVRAGEQTTRQMCQTLVASRAQGWNNLLRQFASAKHGTI